uniref:IENR2 domain-containing protein n=1 Tax=Steinernema glaseri TaxID=37863 RepID=A0A1I7Y729_9BILA
MLLYYTGWPSPTAKHFARTKRSEKSPRMSKKWRDGSDRVNTWQHLENSKRFNMRRKIAEGESYLDLKMFRYYFRRVEELEALGHYFGIPGRAKR